MSNVIGIREDIFNTEEAVIVDMEDSCRTNADYEDTPAAKLAEDNRGVGVIEIILILVVLVALVVIFKDQFTAIVNTALSAVSEDANALIE